MKPFQCFFLLAGLALIQAASADSTLEYLVAEGNSKTGKIQPVIIKDGKIMIKGLGGDGNLGGCKRCIGPRVDGPLSKLVALDPP